jgi:hypothetical protein
MRQLSHIVIIVSAVVLGVAGSALAEESVGATAETAGKSGAAQKVTSSRLQKIHTRRYVKGHKQVKYRPELKRREVTLDKGELVTAQVPELDPNAAGLALVLLAGGSLILVDRRRAVRA